MTYRAISLLVLCCLVGVSSYAAEPSLKFVVETLEMTGDSPMIVFWVEKTDGTFVKTLQMLSKDKKYYPDITTWATSRQDKEKQADFDAVIGEMCRPHDNIIARGVRRD